MLAKRRKVKETSFGDKMQQLRLRKRYSFDGLANETGFTPDYLRKVESKELIPTVSAIIRISKALSVDPGSFLSAEESEASEKRRIESYMKRAEAYSYKPLTPGAMTKHMKAFLVTIDPKTNHKMVEYQHEGEEFIYVLKGELEIAVGDHVQRLKKGESIHFNSAITHRLKNISDKKMELIVVVYTP